MKSSMLVGLSLALSASLASAQECPKPINRPILPVQTAISVDESMAQAFDVAAGSCAREDMACDDARTKCGGQLTSTLQKQLNFDEGAYLRDMLIAYQGQQYRMAAPIPSAPALTDVSCNADEATLKLAGARRRAQAERRKLILAEYPRWQVWVAQQYQLCQDRAAADKVRVDAQAADGARLLAAAEAAKRAKELKVANARSAEQALKDKADATAAAAREKLEADAKAKALKQQQEQDALSAVEKQRQEAARALAAKQEAEKRAAADKAEADRRAKETAEETAARQKREAEEAKIVAEREARKDNAAQRKAELTEKERIREENQKLSHEQARQNAEAAHQKKLDELRHNLELTEADKNAQLASVDKQYEESEAVRREQVKREIDAAGNVDHSDERLGGSLSGHGAAGYFSVGPSSAPLVGGQVAIRQGLWGTAPAAGMAAGVELRATGLFLTAVDGKSQLFSVAPEFRYWFGRLSLGAGFEWQYLKYAAAEGQPNTSTLSLGPTISLAAVDNPVGRLIFTLRWLPFVFLTNQTIQVERVTGEIEGGYGIFSFALHGGALKDTTGSVQRLGWFAGLALGARLRW